MTAGEHTLRCFVDAILDEVVPKCRVISLKYAAARLRFAAVRIEIDVAARRRHSVAQDFLQREVANVGVDDVNEVRVGWIEAHFCAHFLEVRIRRIEPGYSPDSRDPFGCVAGRVSAKRMPNQVDILCPQAMTQHQIFYQERDLKANQSGVYRSLEVNIFHFSNETKYE